MVRRLPGTDPAYKKLDEFHLNLRELRASLSRVWRAPSASQARVGRDLGPSAVGES